MKNAAAAVELKLEMHNSQSCARLTAAAAFSIVQFVNAEIVISSKTHDRQFVHQLDVSLGSRTDHFVVFILKLNFFVAFFAAL